MSEIFRKLVLVPACLLLMFPVLCLGADRLYFVHLVEHDLSSNPRVILEWGPLEGNVPEEIDSFNLYRSINSGDFELLAAMDYQVADPLAIRDFVENDFNQDRQAELIRLLNQMSSAQTPPGPAIDKTNFPGFIHSIIDPASDTFNPLQRMLLIRFHPGVARAAGLAFIDEAPGALPVQYLLTATANGTESLPIGKTPKMSTSLDTVLPAPQGLVQVRTAGCSLIRKNLDDLRVHLNWAVPNQPQDIGLNILTYGYDVFWAETDLGVLDFSAGIPTGLYRVNEKPVVVSGQAPEEEKDGYLVRDTAENHLTGPEWTRGQTFYYYLVARDLAGNYSQAAAPIEATVVDGQPPVSPFRLHTKELSQISGDDALPRLALVWDQINPVNYIRYYGTNRTVCGTDDHEVCTAPSAQACSDETQIRCMDLDVDQYHVFRFDSPREAAAWGTDTDGDLWPDEIEEDEDTDPCDPDEFPDDSPPSERVAVIDQTDTNFQNALADRHVQMVYVDTDLDDTMLDKVFYYRVMARDSSGNLSPMSAPIRGVLYDRTQPEASASLSVLDCSSFFAAHEDTTEYVQASEVLTLVDTTGKAGRFTLFRDCQSSTHMIYDEAVLSGYMDNGMAMINAEDIPASQCGTEGCDGGTTLGYYVVFKDTNGFAMAQSDTFSITSLCSDYNGAVVLDGKCIWNTPLPGAVADGAIKVCADLSLGQTARVYHEIAGKMSPIRTIAYAPDAENDDLSCEEISDMAGLTASDLCLGVRVFSENHVGSGMAYLNCLTVADADASPPPAPLVQGVFSKETQGEEPYFELRWSAPSQGMAGFIVSLTSDAGTKQKTVFPEAPGDNGQFSADIMLSASTDLNTEWCVKMRAIGTDMKMSDWSEQTCAEWTAQEPESLSWPHVSQPPKTGNVRAVFINEGSLGGRPALVFNPDFTTTLSALDCQYSDTGKCIDEVPVCTGSSLCVAWQQETDGTIIDTPVDFSNDAAGNYVYALVGQKNFILYRQEQGRDFVQVSPLIEGFNFSRKSVYVHNITNNFWEWHHYYRLNNPFYFLRNLEESAIGGTDPLTGLALDPAEFIGARMLILDRYPYTPGTTVRYKMVFFDPKTREPSSVQTSNWLTLPSL